VENWKKKLPSKPFAQNSRKNNLIEKIINFDVWYTDYYEKSNNLGAWCFGKFAMFYVVWLATSSTISQLLSAYSFSQNTI